VPDARPLVEHAAVRTLPLPTSETLAQPAIEIPASLKLTVPVGALPVIVAVNVTVVPYVDGFDELATVVVVVVWPPIDICTVNMFAVAASTLMVTPEVASLNDCPATSAASLNVVVAGVMSRSSVSLL
jgi:hypothetical protein